MAPSSSDEQGLRKAFDRFLAHVEGWNRDALVQELEQPGTSARIGHSFLLHARSAKEGKPVFDLYEDPERNYFLDDDLRPDPVLILKGLEDSGLAVDTASLLHVLRNSYAPEDYEGAGLVYATIAEGGYEGAVKEIRERGPKAVLPERSSGAQRTRSPFAPGRFQPGFTTPVGATNASPKAAKPPSRPSLAPKSGSKSGGGLSSLRKLAGG